MATRGRPGSSAIAAAALARSLAGGDPAPVYLLAGPEAVLRDRALEALRARVVEAGSEAFNYRRVEPRELDAQALAVEMRDFPMGGGGRLVVIASAEDLLKDQVKTLADYAADPSPRTTLVLVAAEVKETLKKAFDTAVVVDCSSPWEDRIPDLLVEESRALGVKLGRDGAEWLASICGRDLSRAVGEIRKAAARVGPQGAVTAGLLKEIAGGGEAADVFRVSSSLARGDVPGAIRAARRFMEADDRGSIRILYELAAHLRKLLAARGNVAAGMPPREAARAAGVFWKDADAFAAELSRWDEARIAQAFRRVLAADRLVKRGVDDGAGAIESCLWSAFAGGPGRRPTEARGFSGGARG